MMERETGGVVRAVQSDAPTSGRRRAWLAVTLAGVALLGGAACSDKSDTSGNLDANVGTLNVPQQGRFQNLPPQTREMTVPQGYGGGHLGGTATGDTQAGADFARWVLEQDPQRQYLTDAVVRGETSLGVKVQPNMTKGQLQQLLRALTEGMARTFPGRTLTVTAFYQSGDKLAQSTYNPRTNQIAVQFV